MNHLPARSTDPETSFEAAEHMVKSGKAAQQQATTVSAVTANPGMTSHELARHCVLDRYQLARRLPEVESAGRVIRGEARKCLVTGHRAATWWPAA
ncbi:winged helix-turn-helix domain-containing protein [Pseudoxanthomonas sp.]|uniref:winged helix-turn-helix domain-containing protein n=1 Tax=Pseudoxanthomonas sp. TaxID=1871049 RepID=UPI0026302413|nr:winged helix-turn-helix domain-containing protein [Pseudoxanthomonas sp.]WDS36215.1 MAG: winged helix-turn-helix domain-containing protein [Pseudoxanthomonas sp.]